MGGDLFRELSETVPALQALSQMIKERRMKQNKNVLFMAAVVLAGVLIMNSCGGIETPDVPAAPTIEEIYVDNREVAITWSAVNNAVTYTLYWNTTGGVDTSDNNISGLLVPYYVHTPLSLFKTYSYAVTAVNAGGESGLSNEVSALPALTPEELYSRLASDAEDDDRFGRSVAFDGDHVIVGADFEDGDGGSDRGAAYIFDRDEGGTDNWGEVKKLTASDAADGDQFGTSVSIDGSTAVVGAPYKDSGAAYVFYRNEGGDDNWGQEAILAASDAESGDLFGWSVVVSGNYAVVGAPYEDSEGTDSGAAYVFYRNEGGENNWGQVAILTASDVADGDHFGISVAISGDTVVVGANFGDGLEADSGAAYIFDRNQGGDDTWGLVTKLTASDGQGVDMFGYSVALDGDHVVVGAASRKGDGIFRGAAYIYGRNEGGDDNWGEVIVLTSSDPEDFDYFGGSVALDGDYLIVGAGGKWGDGIFRGAAYIFYRNQGGDDNWGEVMMLTSSAPEDEAYFGSHVAISGDNAIVGAEEEDRGGTDRGAIYIF